jgi:hypothetical protein
MKNFKKIIGSLFTLALLSACEQYELPVVEGPEPGQADFSGMIAIGGNDAAGFMNGALYVDGQENSFPALLAGQLALTGGGTFNQPDLSAAVENGCFNPPACTLGRLYLKLVSGRPTPTPKASGNAEAFLPYDGSVADLNNYSVPGLTVQTALLAGIGDPNPANPYYAYFNPYYYRMASDPGTSTAIGDAATALATNGTFLVHALGMNDVLGYAKDGASNPAILTSEAAFGVAYAGGLEGLLGAKASANGAVANIPDVLDMPYFTTLSYNILPLDAGTASTLMGAGAFGGYNAALDALIANKVAFGISDAVAAEIESRKVNYAAGNNAFLISDESLTDLGPYFDILEGLTAISAPVRAALTPLEQVRQTKSSDKICLTAASVLGTLIGGNPLYINGVTLPLGHADAQPGSDKYIITESEATEITERTAAFNDIIEGAVSGNSDRLVLVDLHTAFKDLKSGVVSYAGSSLTESLAPPFGVMSLDGLTPNARGNGYIANLFINAINNKFGSTIPLKDINSLPGNELPIP